jgi:hypothetical protein
LRCLEKETIVGSDTSWIVRLRPTSGHSIDDLLKLPVALDIWQREPDALIVAVTEITLHELERRRLAHVERLRTTADYIRSAIHQEPD